MSTLLFQQTAQAETPAPKNDIVEIEAERCPDNPLITFETSKTLGDNINGPSVIRVPDWIENPLGRYYMYFAHHSGKDIRLAYADSLSGPWKIYEPGALSLRKAKALKGHIASPDVHIDNEHKELVMYLHGPVGGMKEQQTIRAESADGLTFEPETQLLGTSYFRVFDWKGVRYAIDGRGYLNRAPEDEGRWDQRKERLFTTSTTEDEFGKRKDVRIRHSAVLIEGETLIVFYTRKSDAPERILVSTIRLTDNWEDWQPSEPLEVLRPKESYEGVQYPDKPSVKGSGTELQQLRDPCVFVEGDRIYLFYSVAGEMGIAMAEVRLSLDADACL